MSQRKERKRRANSSVGINPEQAMRQRSLYIPLTQADLERGLSDQQLDVLRGAMNFERTLKELCDLGLRSLDKEAEASTEVVQE